MSVVLQISDTHFGTEQTHVVDALVRLALSEQPDVVVVSGDITQRARRAQFAAARRFLDRLAVSDLVIVPGNHDIPLFDVAARFIAPYGHHCEVFGEHLEPVFESADLSIVGVNTTRRTRHKHGEVSPAQVARVAKHLSGSGGQQLRMVVTHHPVCVIRAEDEINLLRGAQAAVRAWVNAGADLILGGHIHLPYVRALPVAGATRQAWAVQAGTAVSTRIRDGIPNSVNIIRYAGEPRPAQCVIERWDHDATARHFHPVERTGITPVRADKASVSERSAQLDP